MTASSTATKGIAGACAVSTLCAALVLASAAVAQTAPRPVVSAGEASRAAGVAPSRRALRVDRSGRWSVDFSLNPSGGNPAQVVDMGAGAYYRVSPRLRVGASAGVTETPAEPGRPIQAERNVAPRVRLESIFRF